MGRVKMFLQEAESVVKMLCRKMSVVKMFNTLILPQDIFTTLILLKMFSSRMSVVKMFLQEDESVVKMFCRRMSVVKMLNTLILPQNIFTPEFHFHIHHIFTILVSCRVVVDNPKPSLYPLRIV